MPTPAAASLDLPASAAASLDLCASAVTYPGRPERVRQARAAARGLLAGCPAADEVILCLSELAANAVLHSDSPQARRNLHRPHRELPRRLHAYRGRRRRRALAGTGPRPRQRPRA